jgi:hypothetical protein
VIGLMVETLTEQIMQKLEEVTGLYHRLILVVAPTCAGKTAALQDVQKQRGVPLINVNLEISLRLLDLTTRQRALQLSQILSQIVDATQADTILLDNIEMLFDTALKQNPLRLL